MAHGGVTQAGNEDDGDDEDEKEDEDERRHFKGVLFACDYYRTHSLARVGQIESNLARLHPRHRELLQCHVKVEALRRAVEANARVLDAILEPHQFLDDPLRETGMHTQALRDRSMLQPGAAGPRFSAAAPPPESEMDKVKSTLKQFVRDWSSEGSAERATCYAPLLADLDRLYPAKSVDRGKLQVLVPGAGLGRLAWEVARRGFNSQGNEFSYYMLLASNWVLNHANEEGPVDLFPFVHQSINVRAPEDQVRSVRVPDVRTDKLPGHVHFSMCAGDFLAVYRDQRDAWDCVVSCFFVDTAHDVTEYVRRIFAALRPGGTWLNLGPLLYHYAEMSTEFSVELSWTELRAVIADTGFVVESESWVQATYSGNSLSMLHSVYDCVHTVCRKPAEGEGAHSHAAP